MQILLHFFAKKKQKSEICRELGDIESFHNLINQISAQNKRSRRMLRVCPIYRLRPDYSDSFGRTMVIVVRYR